MNEEKNIATDKDENIINLETDKDLRNVIKDEELEDSGMIYFQKHGLDEIDQQVILEVAQNSFFITGMMMENANQEETDKVFKQLQLPEQPRFRSKFIIKYKDRKYFIYRARQGGGNRGDHEDPKEQEEYCYQKYNKTVYDHPAFLADIDEKGDNTYNLLIFAMKD